MNEMNLPPSTQVSATNKLSVRLDGVSKNYGYVRVLHDVWLSVAKGEFLTLLGPSGCGKSTILNLIAGFIECSGGEIFIDGEVVTTKPTYQREIGIVFQNYALFPHMSVRKNVGYGLAMRKVPRAEIDRRVEKALDLVKLADYRDRRPKELSGGQQQRVALARALVVEPKVLLLDEPFSALDKNLRGAMQVELKEIQRKTGVTTVFVTHDQGEALSMSDRIVVMSEGRIRQMGTPEEIYNRPADRFVATFIGDASRFSGRVDDAGDGRLKVTIGTYGLDLGTRGASLVCGQTVDVFVRPESMRLVPNEAANSIAGTVRNVVYQGGHVDAYLDCEHTSGSPVLMRLAAPHASRLQQGQRVVITIDAAGTSAFPSP
ncbi:ABC transporter ATP-binding protein [Microbacteriaceae bacterium K1510]|nr:ABC transporter ATP-binding protein [Microbacteriaceae bacterium K1510]